MRIVLDYIKRLIGRNILIPPFHGHLGFLPDTEVWVYLMSPNSTGPACEVLITPYELQPENIMLLSCTLKDGPGAVNQLVGVIAGMGINIVSLETSVINHLNHHRVNMTLDWSTSEKFPRRVPSSQKVQRTFWNYSTNLPIDDQRCVELFQRVVEECRHSLVWEERAGKEFPSISLLPVSTPDVNAFGVVTVKRHQNEPADAESKPAKRQLHTEIELPMALFQKLGIKLKTNGEPLNYILLSETETRTLRVLFPRPDIVPRIVHLGFYHLNIPGALSVILGPLARAKFNILHCLVRQNTASLNVLEAFLEYRGDGEVPFSLEQIKRSPEAGEQICEWAAEKMMTNLLAEEVEELKNCALQIGLANYPKPKWAGKINFGQVLERLPVTELKTRDAGGARRHPDAHDFPHSQENIKLIATIEQLRANAVPSIFLSYPHGAADHAELLKERLVAEGYSVVEYQTRDGKMIMDEVMLKIGDCDYFVGIWHNQDETGMSLSTWLPIEWAFARAFRKKALVVHSKKLHPEVWKSVNPDVAQIEYVDVKFGSETVPQILRYCREHFVDEGRTVVPFRPRKAAEGDEHGAGTQAPPGEFKLG
jgi:acetolactate synthase small subunit